LAHTAAEPVPLIRDVTERLARGVRLNWNVLPNIELVRKEQPQKAARLEIVRKVMIGEQKSVVLDKVAADWSPELPQS
jgi:hypothetical protein